MRILNTSGGRFIGYALAKKLKASGNIIFCLDEKSSEPCEVNNTSNDFHQIQGDVQNEKLIKELVLETDIVIHHQSRAAVYDSTEKPQHVISADILGTCNVLNACLSLNRPVMLLSSSEVYGKNSALLNESADSVFSIGDNARWAHALTMSLGEQYARSLVSQGLRTLIVRPFNVYGPHSCQPETQSVIDKFLDCLRKGQPLPLVDNGRAIRSFCYIDDAIMAMEKLFYLLQNDSSICGQAFNVGRFEPITIHALAKMLIEMTGHQAGTVNVDSKDLTTENFEEIPVRIPDLTALAQETGFQAEISLVEGLRKTLEYWGLPANDPSSECINSEVDNKDREIVPWVRPYLNLDEDLITTLRGTIDSGRVTNCGPLVQKLEKELAAYLGVEDTVVVASGSAALLLSIKALGFTSGKVILPSFTYIATLNAVIHAGLTPVFCDIDPHTWTMDPTNLAHLLNQEKDVRVVIPVNTFGVPPDLESIFALAQTAGAEVLLDNAHGFGVEYMGKNPSSMTTLQAFSLHATKIMPAVEGGFVVSANENLLAEIKRLSVHGLSENLLDSSPGYNEKMSELHAAVGLHNLKTFTSILERRRSYGKRLRAFVSENCSDVFTNQQIPTGVETNFQNLGIRCSIKTKMDITKVAQEFGVNGIDTKRYFWPPLHYLKPYREKVSLPRTERVCSSLLCLPLHSNMDELTLHRLEQAYLKTAKRIRLA